MTQYIKTNSAIRAAREWPELSCRVTRPKADIIGSAAGSIIVTDIAIHIAMVTRRSVELVVHMSIVFTEAKVGMETKVLSAGAERAIMR